MHHVRRVVSLGIEGGRERQHVRGTKLHAEAASLAALHDNRNTSFCHISPSWSEITPGVQQRRMGLCPAIAIDGVIAVTSRREEEHDVIDAE
jgi:hypothetical protein